MSKTFYLPESLAVADTAVVAVLRMENGNVVATHEIIDHDYNKAIQQRMDLLEGNSTGTSLYGGSETQRMMRAHLNWSLR